jgi:hypothetical protein
VRRECALKKVVEVEGYGELAAANKGQQRREVAMLLSALHLMSLRGARVDVLGADLRPVGVNCALDKQGPMLPSRHLFVPDALLPIMLEQHFRLVGERFI